MTNNVTEDLTQIGVAAHRKSLAKLEGEIVIEIPIAKEDSSVAMITALVILLDL